MMIESNKWALIASVEDCQTSETASQREMSLTSHYRKSNRSM
jgi:hypothetical protein